MGAFDKHKRLIKRQLKSHRSSLDKARKLTQQLFYQLREVEGSICQIDQVVNELPTAELDEALKLTRSNKAIFHTATLKRLVHRVGTSPARMCMARAARYSKVPLVPASDVGELKSRRMVEPSPFSLRARLIARQKVLSQTSSRVSKPSSTGSLMSSIPSKRRSHTHKDESEDEDEMI